MSGVEVVPDVGHRVDIDWEERKVRATRQLRSSGGSTVVTIPPDVLEMMDLDEGDDVLMVADWEDGTITLRPATE